MTENEAKTILTDLAFDESKITDNKEVKALQKAVIALSEIQQYREIGTVEEVKAIVDIGKWGYRKGYNKAIDEFASEVKWKLFKQRVSASDIDEIAEEMKAGGNR